MTSKSLSLTTLSCVLATAGLGCAKVAWSLTQDHLSSESFSKPSSINDAAGSETKARSRTARTGAPAIPVPSAVPEVNLPESSPDTVTAAPKIQWSEQQLKRQQKYWDAGVSAAHSAAIAEQSAITNTDWNQIISQWQSAINFLSEIEPNSPQYLNAQTKLAIYQAGLKRAEEQYIAVVQNRYHVLSDPAADSAAQSSPESLDNAAHQLRSWIQQGQFKQAEAFLNQVTQTRQLTPEGLDYADAVLVNAASSDDAVLTKQLMAKLNDWVTESPRSSMAYTTRAYFTQASLWQDVALTPGQQRKHCPPTQADRDRLEATSLTDTQIAISLDAKNPAALMSKLRLAKMGVVPEGSTPAKEAPKLGSAQRNQTIEAAFQAVNQVWPHSFQAHLEKASYLVAQDKTGSGQAALQFLRAAQAEAPRDSALPMLLPVIHGAIANHQGNQREYLSQPQVWQEIQQSSEQVIVQLPNAATYSTWFADWAKLTGQNELSRRYQQIALNRLSAAPAAGIAFKPKIMRSM